MNKIIKNTWKIICYPLLYLGMRVVVSVAYAFIKSVISNEKMVVDLMALTPTIISIFAVGAILFFIFNFNKNNKSEKILIFKKAEIIPLTLSFILAFAMSILTVVILSKLPTGMKINPSFLDKISDGSIKLKSITMIIFIPYIEGIIFRGIVQKRLANIMNFWAAIFVQAAIFGWLHLDIVHGLYAFILGIIMGYVCLKFDYIFYAIFIHIIFNWANIIFLNYFSDLKINSIFLIIISAVIFIISLAGLILLGKRRKTL